MNQEKSESPPRPLTVLELRSASGSGGGPDKTIFATVAQADPARLRHLVVYLRKPRETLDGVRQRAEAAGVPLLELPGGSLLDMRQFAALHRLVVREGVDVLHCHEPKGDFYGALAKVFSPRLKVMTTLHGWTSPRSAKSALYARLDRLTLSRFDLVAAVSRPLEAAARAAGARRVLYLPNGVDCQAWRPGAPAPARLQNHPALRALATARTWIGYVGRLAEEKAPDEFLRLAVLLADKHPEAGFVLAGDGPLLEECRENAAVLGIADRTLFLGRVEEELVRAVLGRLSLLVNPSHTEGMPNNLLEAMAMGLPVVATAVGGVPDLVQDGVGGLLVRDGDLAQLSRACLAVLEDRDLSRRLGEGARREVEARFSFGHRVRLLTEAYESLVRDGRHDWQGGTFPNSPPSPRSLKDAA